MTGKRHVQPKTFIRLGYLGAALATAASLIVAHTLQSNHAPTITVVLRIVALGFLAVAGTGIIRAINVGL